MKIVLGGGIGGLSAAYYLRTKFPLESIRVYESSNKTGGWIKSKRLPDGTIFEQGPRTLRPKGPAGFNTLELVDELGLSDKIVPIKSSHPAAKNRMIFANGKLHMLPSSLPDIFKTSTPFSKPLISYLLNDLTAKSLKIQDESIYDFVERRFGTDLAQYAISSMICGICAGDAKNISVKFLMKSIFEKEQKYGGVIKGVLYDLWENGMEKSRISSTLGDLAKSEKWSIYSFDGGMETLSNGLENKLNEQNVDLILNSNCDRIEFSHDSAFISVDGFTQECIAKHIISSLPAPKLGALIQHQHPVLTELLEQIPHVDVAVVNLYYKQDIFLDDAFGFLVPPSENLPILGVIFDSCCFPKSDSTVLTVMMGGQWFDKYFAQNSSETYLLNTAIEQIKNILRITAEPDEYEVNILRNCIPQYVVGHSDRIGKIEQYIKDNKLPLSICGSSYYGVGVNDVILSARNATCNIK